MKNSKRKHAMIWIGRSSHSYPLPWVGIPSIRSDSSGPCHVWSCALPGMEHPQLLWAIYSAPHHHCRKEFPRSISPNPTPFQFKSITTTCIMTTCSCQKLFSSFFVVLERPQWGPPGAFCSPGRIAPAVSACLHRRGAPALWLSSWPSSWPVLTGPGASFWGPQRWFKHTRRSFTWAEHRILTKC